MRVWYWCPCCERAFQAEAPPARRSPLTDLLTSLGICEPAPANCPYDHCRASARCILTWASLRRWAASLGSEAPAVPASAQRYPAPASSEQDTPALAMARAVPM